MADWVDALSDSEVQALYKYKSGGVDTLSDDEVKLIFPYKDKLKVPKGPDTSIDLEPLSTAIKSSFASAGTAVDRAASGIMGAAAGLVSEDARDSIFSAMEERAKEREQWANPTGVELSTGQKVAGTLATLPMQIPAAILSPFSTGQTAIKVGESLGTVQTAQAIDSLGNLAGFAMGPMGKGLVVPTLTGGAVNAAQEYLTKKGIQGVMETEAGKKAFEPTLSDVISSGIVGGAMGMATAKPGPKKPTKVPADKTTEPKVQGSSILDEVKSEVPTKDLFPETLQDQTGHATPYDAGQMGVTEPVTPLRVRRQQELGFPETPGTINVDAAGVSVRPEDAAAVEAMKAREMARMDADAHQRLAAEQLTAKQGELFEPETNMHRDYTDMRVSDGRGGERSLTFKEFEQTLANLEAQKETAFRRPEDMQKAYDDYLVQVSGRQADMFDIGSRQEAFARGVLEDQLPSRVDNHPFVRNAEKRLAKQEKFVEDLKAQIASGETKATALIGEMKALKEAQEKVAAVRENVEAGLRKGENPPFNTRTRKQGGGVKFDWGDNRKVELFRNIPGIGNALRDVGHSLIKSPEEAIELAKNVPDVQQGVISKATNWLTKGGDFLKNKVGHPLVHYTVDTVKDAYERASSKVSQIIHEDYLPKVRALTDAEFKFAAELLSSADLNKKVITQEMMDRHGVAPRVQELVRSHQMGMAEALDQVNKALVSMGKNPITAREGYSAFNASGNFRKVVRKDGEVVGIITSNVLKEPNRVFKAWEKTRPWSLERIEAQLKEKDPTLEFGPLDDVSKPKGMPPKAHGDAFADAMQVLGEDNPKFAEFLDILREVAKDDPANFMGMHKHTMGKKGVFGMEGRKSWLSAEENAKAFFENQVKYMESALQWAEMAQASKDVNKVLRDESIVGKHDNAIKLSEDYLNNALGLNKNRLGKAIDDVVSAISAGLGYGPAIPKKIVSVSRQVANTAMLAFDHTFLALQMLQPMLNTPAMTSLLRGRGVDGSITLGMAKGTETLYKLTMHKDLTAFEKQLVDFNEKHHVYASDLIKHANQVRKDMGYYLTKGSQSPMAAVETATRATTFVAVAHILKDAGLTKETGLFEQAKNFTDKVMVNYSHLERPKIYDAFGPLGSVAYNLKSFGHHQISLYSMYLRELATTGNGRPLAVQMMTQMAFAGMFGLPFFSLWEAVYDEASKLLGHPRSLALDVMDLSKQVTGELGTAFNFALSHGLLSTLGADVSVRTGLGDVLPSHAQDVAFAGAGKLADMASSVGKAIVSPSEYHTKQAAINLAPKGIQGLLDEAWFTKGDIAYSKTKEMPTPMARRNELDHTLKKFGLTGINESIQKAKVYQQGKIDEAITGYRTSAMTHMLQNVYQNKPINQSDITAYFGKGQGDPNTWSRELVSQATKMGIPPNEIKMMQLAASKQIPQLQSLVRRTQ